MKDRQSVSVYSTQTENLASTTKSVTKLEEGERPDMAVDHPAINRSFLFLTECRLQVVPGTLKTLDDQIKSFQLANNASQIDLNRLAGCLKSQLLFVVTD